MPDREPVEAPHTSPPIRSSKARLRTGLLLAICLLYIGSVPWYRDLDSPLRLWWGLPDWVMVALLCYVGSAVLNAWAWWITDVSDDDPTLAPHSERAP